MTRREILSAMEQLAQQQAVINQQIEQLQIRLNQLDDEERIAKINEVTELLANASLQQVDHILNYLRGVENISASTPQVVVEPVDIAVAEADAEAMTEPVVVVTPTPTVPVAQPVVETEPVNTEQANVEDYLVDGRIPWTDATISVVGLSHQTMWTVDHDSPQVGDRVKLYPPQRQDGRIVRSILAHTMEDEPRAIGILPQSDSKIAELEAIGAPVIKNRDAYADEAMRNGKMATVVGVIPGRYCFIKLDEEEPAPSTSEPTAAETIIPEGIDRILEGFAANAAEARRMFEAQKASHHLFSKVEEIGRFFKVEYFDNRCNSNDFIKSVAVAKAE
jgi:hypothetical protein